MFVSFRAASLGRHSGAPLNPALEKDVWPSALQAAIVYTVRFYLPLLLPQKHKITSFHSLT